MADLLNFDLAATLLIALALGGMVLFTAVYAPTALRVLPAEHAGALLRAVFPKYFGANAALTGAAALCLYGRPEGWALAGVFGLFLGVMLVILPRIDAVRDARMAGDAAARRRFGRLHAISFSINLLQMLVLLGVFVRLTH